MHLYCCTYQYVSCQFISLSLLSYSYRFRTPDTQLFFGQNSGGKNSTFGVATKGEFNICMYFSLLLGTYGVHTYGYRLRIQNYIL